MNYIATIGLEVHVQLKTRSKMLCACPVEFGAEPNAHTCPVCLGLPGALPVMNHEALRMTVVTGLMLGCDIAPLCKFDRKNYFYPDMPKNYQISQYDMPLCANGSVPLHDLAYPKDEQKNIAVPNKEVRLVRIHLEEDVAKSFHFETTTGIDFNRAGTPLMEIVTQPEITLPEEALGRGEKLEQETRGWDDAMAETFLMRTKESAHDYRYFPDPDLVPVKTEGLLSDVRARLPELPKQKRARFVQQYGVTVYDAGVLANDLELAAYFEKAARDTKKQKTIANWILKVLQSVLKAAVKTIKE